MTYSSKSAVRNKVLNKGLSQFGYSSPTSWSKYGSWYGGDATDNFLWCAIFQAWAFQEALGFEDAAKLIGNQPNSGYANRAGHSWTVSMLESMERMGCEQVSAYNAQPGDIAFTRWANASGGRSTNRVNHVDMVAKAPAYSVLPCLGGNTPKPGTYGDPSAGRGVWLHQRIIHSTPFVAIMRPKWGLLVTPVVPKARGEVRILTAPRAGTVSTYGQVVQRMLGRSVTKTFSAYDVNAVKQLQRSLGVEADGLAGTNTAQAYLLRHIRKYGNLNKGDVGTAVGLWQYVVKISSSEIDRKFGDRTKNRTVIVQKSLKLAADGVAGPDTIRAAL